ncbi:hypothetical protein XENTR_v10018570 [Xenopus tropicalis]|nr:hypothetical protein XENTR_v10018570 [Xenopus tropicalis]
MSQERCLLRTDLSKALLWFYILLWQSIPTDWPNCTPKCQIYAPNGTRNGLFLPHVLGLPGHPTIMVCGTEKH